MARVVVTASGNCNFNYITGLALHVGKPEVSLEEVLTAGTDPYSLNYRPVKPGAATPEPVYKAPSCGMFLFAQGSDDPVSTRPYAPQFKKLIEDNGLGKVTEIEPVPNPLHNNRVGILYVWVINHEACRVWWHTNVLANWKAKQAKAADKIKKEIK